MIHSEYGYTVKDCRTEQRQRWDNIRYDERMNIEKKGERRDGGETEGEEQNEKSAQGDPVAEQCRAGC